MPILIRILIQDEMGSALGRLINARSVLYAVKSATGERAKILNDHMAVLHVRSPAARLCHCSGHERLCAGQALRAA